MRNNRVNDANVRAGAERDWCDQTILLRQSEWDRLARRPNMVRLDFAPDAAAEQYPHKWVRYMNAQSIASTL